MIKSTPKIDKKRRRGERAELLILGIEVANEKADFQKISELEQTKVTEFSHTESKTRQI